MMIGQVPFKPIARCSYSNECVLELVRTEGTVTYMVLTTSGLVIAHDGTPQFDRKYDRLPKVHTVEATPRDYARVYLNDIGQFYIMDPMAWVYLCYIMQLDENEREVYKDMAILVHSGDLCVVGHFENDFDANLVARSFPFKCITVKGPEDLALWQQESVMRFRNNIDPDAPVPTKAQLKDYNKFLKEVYIMAKAAPKKAPAPKAAAPAAGATAAVKGEKAAKVVKEKVVKTDGPVFKVKAYLEKNKDKIVAGKLTRNEVAEAIIALGVNKSTMGVQVGAWAKANGVTFTKPAPAVKAKAEKAPKAEAAAKPAKGKRAAPEAGAAT